jgi:exonuclease VII large subunit
MRRLLNQVRQDLRQKLQAMQQKIKKLDKKLRQKLDALKQQAQSLIQSQKQNTGRTRQGRYSQAGKEQKQINKGLESIFQTTQRLSQDYPFILHNLKGEAHIAKIMGDVAKEKLQKRDRRRSLDAQKKVIEHLQNFLKQIRKQKKRYKNIMNGNFSGILPQSLMDRFVIIPKKGSTEVPMDYRDQIIENSKKRQDVPPQIEKFWRNLLH